MRDRCEQIYVTAVIAHESKLGEHPWAIGLAAACVERAVGFDAVYGDPNFSFAPTGLIALDVTSREPARVDWPAEQFLGFRMLVGAGDSFENQGRRPKQQSKGHKVMDLRHVRKH